MECCRGGSDQARPCRPAHSEIAGAFRRGRLAALRPGQMVSRREPAALGIRSLLAQGWRVDLEKLRPDRWHRRAAQAADRRRRAVRGRYGETTWTRFRMRHASFRRPQLLAAEGSELA